MSPAKSDEKGSNEPAPPRQDQPDQDQGPTPGVKYTEQVTQPIKQEVSIAIMTYSNPILTPPEFTAFEESSRLARSQPLPDEDDFADKPLSEPYDPKTSNPYDWTKPEA
jgi:hypothetical protein